MQPHLPRRVAIAFTAALSLASLASARAEDDAANVQAQANNPLADITAFNIQNYYIGELTGPADNANQFVLRYAKPVDFAGGSWLVRASLPLNTFPTGADLDHETGLGDANVFAAYLFDTGDPTLTFGVGPQITLPTATDDDLGSEKTSLGFANVAFKVFSPKVQAGYLLTWQHSVAGPDNAPDVNAGAFQPFAFYQLGDGWYTGGAPIWTYNFENDDYSIPLGLRLGKVIKVRDTAFNFFVEPQYSVADRGIGQPEWQIYFALNMQFY